MTLVAARATFPRPDQGASFPLSHPSIGREAQATADHPSQYQQCQQQGRPYSNRMSGPGTAKDMVSERRISIAAAAVAVERPHAQAAACYYGIAVPMGPPHPQGPVLQNNSSIDGGTSAGSDPKAAAERPWWAQLLD